jgi:hypothetical protein
METHDEPQEATRPQSEGGNVHTCEVCKEKFSNVNDFIFHMETDHYAVDVRFLSWI